MNPRPAHYECAALPLSYCGDRWDGRVLPAHAGWIKGRADAPGQAGPRRGASPGLAPRPGPPLGLPSRQDFPGLATGSDPAVPRKLSRAKPRRPRSVAIRDQGARPSPGCRSRSMSFGGALDAARASRASRLRVKTDARVVLRGPAQAPAPAPGSAWPPTRRGAARQAMCRPGSPRPPLTRRRPVPSPDVLPGRSRPAGRRAGRRGSRSGR